MNTNKHISVSEKLINPLHGFASKSITTATALTVVCLLINACAPSTPVNSVGISETAPIIVSSTATNTIVSTGTLDVRESNNWQKYEPTTDLSPGSELATKLDALNLDRGYVTISESSYTEINGKFVTLGKVGYVEDVEVVPIRTDGFSGRVITIYTDVKISGGTYVRLPLLGAVQSDDTSVGFGMMTTGYAEEFDKMFRLPNGMLSSITFDQALTYFKSRIGHTMSFNTPVWDTMNNPFDPNLFALTMFGEYDKSSGITPGNSNFEWENGMYRFVQKVCGGSNGCYETMVDRDPSLYCDYTQFRELVRKSPYRIFVKYFGE